MAKFVGKIFRVSNSKLKLHGNDSHYVSVKWYNPFNHKFKCKVITSLEGKYTKAEFSELTKLLSKREVKKLVCSTYDKESGMHLVFKKNKYPLLRNGKIEPIPINQCENFDVWSGYSKTVYLSKKDLNHKTKLNIKK